MRPKRVLAILGSPHIDGATATMLNHSICEAEKAGYTIAKINLYEKRLAFCAGCRRCLEQSSKNYSQAGGRRCIMNLR